ncbi:MAG: response regulator [Chloroflexi bacterium]|nr:response regulator [Chloroflexota bacterium]
MSINPKILYIEDDVFSREIMTVLITEVLGYRDYVVYQDSSNFEEKLAAVPFVPDIIFLDIHVEPIDGFEMLKICRAKTHLDKTPIIALTASIMAEEVNDIRQEGFDGLVGKPINQMTFPDLLQRIIQGDEVWDEVWDLDDDFA